MRIEYTLTEEDFIAFNIHLHKTSKSLKRQVFYLRILGPIFFLFGTFISHVFLDMPLILMTVMYTIAGLIWYFFYPKHMEKGMAKRLKKVLAEGDNSKKLCDYTLTVLDEGLYIESDYSNGTDKWTRFDRYEYTDSYIFLYESAVSAKVIPTDAFKSKDDESSFIELLKQNIN